MFLFNFYYHFILIYIYIYGGIQLFLSFYNGTYTKKALKYSIYCEFFLLLLSYLPTPPLGQDMTQGQFLSGV